jgi:Protein glycosylation ligase
MLLRTVIFFVFIAFPWLNPLATGPSAAMVPWLMSLTCVAAALWFAPVQKGGSISNLSLGLTAFFSFNAAYFALHMLWQESSVEALATLVAWGGVAAMAAVGAQLALADAQARDSGMSNASSSTAREVGAVDFSYVQHLAWLWLSVALLSVAMALCQYLRIEHWFSPWISHSGDGTAYANLRQRNQFATLCGMGLLALLYLQQTLHQTLVSSLAPSGALDKDAHGTPSRAAQRWQAAWPWLAVLALAVGNGLSSSRTGAVQWLLVAGIVWCWRGSLQVQVFGLWGFGHLCAGSGVHAMACQRRGQCV